MQSMQTVVSAKSERLKTHRQKCTGEINKEYEQKSDNEESNNEHAKPKTPAKRKFTDNEESQASPSNTLKRMKMRQRHFSHFCVSTDSDTWQKLDEQIATMFFACNLPFNIADNPVWRETIEMLRPGYYSLANILHPQYRSKLLKPEQIARAQKMLQEELVPELLKFMCDDRLLPKSITNETTIKNVSPVVWWKSIERCGVLSPSLCKLACKLLSMPSSSASIDRIFSNFGMVQTKLRNKLGIQKCAKLVFCYRMLRGREEMEW